nr:hypothetical protein [Hydrogenophaga sp.]
ALSMTQADAFSEDQYAAMDPTQQAALLTSPLVLDLDGNGIQTLHVSQGVMFDINGTGQAVQTGWVAPTDGLLAMDRNGDGLINDGSELFGTATRLADGSRAPDGFAALAELDSNGDGVIDLQDLDYAQLRVWQDGNSDGVSQSDELLTLDQLGITAIRLDASATSQLNEGNWVGLTSSFETSDGQVNEIADVWFRVEQEGSIDSLLEEDVLDELPPEDEPVDPVDATTDGVAEQAVDAVVPEAPATEPVPAPAPEPVEVELVGQGTTTPIDG